MSIIPKDRFIITCRGRYFDVQEDCFVDFDNHAPPTYTRSELELLVEQDPDKFRKCKIEDSFKEW